ncbi:polygalacturonase inhibitor 1-like [Chenopodium quinoa]|uniref:Leucine-rich repeat-containing N-terminal plant-type domain-containing protein n=1 Tax=Chenopodium quinoa TaxID=63459 RepID=A0A803MA40_CHEQI|nr:polygalacturonase inhibitor 1-like [Chenopodium quinoa]
MVTPPKLPLLVSFTLLISSLTLTNADVPPCNAQDQAVLIKIRDHFGGINGPLSDWDAHSDCCLAFNYVGCSSKPGSEYGRVTGVTFSPDIGLSGTIPSDIGDLPFLDFFTLAGNTNVTGPIPTSLAKLNKLYHLDIGHNSLTGPIPSQIFKLKKLKEIDFSGNQLSGPIPSSVTSLPLLTQLNLSDNKLTGSIPPMPKTLKSLDVSNNQLCGPIPSGLKKFSASSFGRNKCLCGAPLAVKCK